MLGSPIIRSVPVIVSYDWNRVFANGRELPMMIG